MKRENLIRNRDNDRNIPQFDLTHSELNESLEEMKNGIASWVNEIMAK